jgi:hypothetical protein
LARIYLRDGSCDDGRHHPNDHDVGGPPSSRERLGCADPADLPVSTLEFVLKGSASSPRNERRVGSTETTCRESLRAVVAMAVGQRSIAWRPLRRCHGFHDAADHDTIGEHVIVVITPLAG